MNKERAIPSIRFSGFIEDWKKCKISCIADKTYGGGTPSTKIKGYWKGDFPWIQSSDLKVDKLFDIKPSKFITQEAIEKSAARMIPSDSITIVTRVGVGKLAYMPFSYATSQDFLSLSRLKIDPYFGVYSLYKLLQIEIKYLQGTSIKGITKKDLLDKKLVVPKNDNESIKIGSLFKQIDETITLQQQLLTDYKRFKKAMLQQLFPQKGETVPKVRFAGFTQEWIEKEMGELTDIKTGKKDVQDAEEKGNYPFYIRSDEIKRINTFSFDGEAILIPGEGRLGQIYHYINGKFDYHQRVYKISGFNKLSGLYLLYFMKLNFKRHAMKYTVKATVDSLRLPMLKEFKVLVPTLEEQEKIGHFFKQLDETIAGHEQKLATYQELKKALLQRMFV